MEYIYDGVVNVVDIVKVVGAIGGGVGAPSLYPQTLAMFTTTGVQKWVAEAKHLKHLLIITDIARGFIVFRNLSDKIGRKLPNVLK